MKVSQEKFISFWERYKALFDTPEFDKHEKYKWPVLGQCYSKWKWNGEDKVRMFIDTFNVKGGKNLWMSGNFLPIKMIEQYFEIDQKMVVDNFNLLFDENINLESRISSFISFNDGFLQRLQKNKPEERIVNHYHGDLRAISLYLSLQYPEKYFLYKHTMFKTFSDQMGLTPVRTGQVSNYSNYLEICQEIKNYIQKDESFLQEYKIFCSKNGHYDDPNLHLLVQDFIYTVASYFNGDVHYWIFQCNPKMFDLVTALDENLVETWTVSAHKDKIKEGDKVIIWMTGEESGCYALADVIGEPELIGKSKDDHLWKEDHKSETKVRIEITHNFSERPIFKSQIADVKLLSEFKGGHQGTNLQSSKEEYETFVSLSKAQQGVRYWIYSPGKNGEKWDEFFNSGIMAIGWDYLGDLKQYIDKKVIVAKLQDAGNTTGSKKNDATANYEFCHIMKPNDVVFVKRGKFDFIGYGIVQSDYYFDDFRLDFKSCRKVSWIKKGIWKDRDIVLKTLTDITYYPDYYKRLLKLLEVSPMEKKDMNIHPLNTILFGPPGTGKTFNTINKAISIIHPDFDLTKPRSEIKKEYERLTEGGQIVFTTFHQSMSYEDFIEGIKPIEPKNEGQQVTYKVIPGIFKEICERIKNIEKLTANSLITENSVSTFDQLYSVFIKRLKEIIYDLEENETHYFESRRSKVKLVKIGDDNSILTTGETANSTETITKDKLERIYNKFNSPDEITNLVKQLREVGTDIGWTTNYFAVFKALKEFESSVKTNINSDGKIKKNQNFVIITRCAVKKSDK